MSQQVNSFREVVGSDGEVTYEFCSDVGESSDSSEDADYVPPAARLARRNAIPNLDTATDWAESLVGGIAPAPVNLDSDSSSSSSSLPALEVIETEPPGVDYGDLTLPQGSRPHLPLPNLAGLSTPTPGPSVSRLALEMLARSQEEVAEGDEDDENDHMPTLMTSWMDDDSSDSSFSPPSYTPIPVTRPKRRNALVPKRKNSKKLKKVKRQPRISAPPRELPPAIVYQDVECFGRIGDYKRNFRPYRVHIVQPPTPFSSASAPSSTFDDSKPSTSTPVRSDSSVGKDKFDKAKEKAYKIGDIEMTLEVPNSVIPSFDHATIWNEFPGLVSIQFSIHNGTNVILMKQEKHLSDEESAAIGPPRGQKDKFRNRTLNYIQVQHYYFPFQIGGTVPVQTLTGLQNKSIRLDFVNYDADSGRMLLNVMLLEFAILGDHDLNSMPASLTGNRRNLLSFFFGVDPIEKIQPQEKEDIEWFYGQVQKYHKSEVLPSPTNSLQHPSMNPTLRDYQKDAVRWMLHKEGTLNKNSFSTSASTSASVPISSTECTTSNFSDIFLDKMSIPIEITDLSEPEDSDLHRRHAFFNPFVGYVSWSRPEISQVTSGGILADEMGLGKTVEVLALILLNPCPELKDENIKIENEDDDDEEKEYVAELPKNSYSEGDSYNSASDPDFSPAKNTNAKPSPSSDEASDSDSGEDFNAVRSQKNKRKKGVKKAIKIRNHIAKKAKRDKKQLKVKPKVVPKPKKAQIKSRKRALSPCEFQAHNFDFDTETATHSNATNEGSQANANTAKTEDKIDENVSQSSPQVPLRKFKVKSKFKRVAMNSSVEEEGEKEENVRPSSPLPAPAPPKKRNRRISSTDSKNSNSNENEPEKKKKETTYDKIKGMYEAALNEYRATPVVQPKFHGTFFDTCIKAKARFECICGDGVSDRRKIISCSHCLSSQHAECVGFEFNGKRSRKSYLCPHCQTAAPPVRTKATIIVTPTTISHQWIKEIQRHVKNRHLNILFYKGVNKHGYMSPHKLAEYDLVITTYTVLSADLNHAKLSHTNSDEGMKFRNAKKYMTIPSSLGTVYWWRICLDEAQMVEGVATKMAEMATQIQGVHRWCITGTPLNKGLQDLFGLVSFLGIAPVCQDFWWEYLVRIPFFKKDTSLLFEFFGQLIWRTGKPSVLNQLGIPPQKEICHWLQFSPVEAHFYKRQYEICSSKIIAKIARLRQLHGDIILQTRLSSLDRQTLHAILHPFLELRQACCHPQMVRGNVLNLQKLKGTMSMEELLNQLIKKTTFQCAEDHRLIIAALNGLAGLFIISSRWAEASDKYREVLERSEKHNDKFKTDSLQLLHALDNLADLLDGNYPGIGYTLSDDRLRPHAEEIRHKYLEKYALAVKTAKDTVDPVTVSVVELMENFKCIKESWWFGALRRAIMVKKDDDLVGRIRDDLLYKAKIYKKKSANSIANRFRDASGLQHLLIEKIQELEELRDSMLGSLDELLNRESSTFVEPAVHCHLRGQTAGYYNERKNGFRCQLCENHDQFIQYEALLFSTQENEKISRVGRNRQVNNFAGDASTELTAEEKALILMREQEELLETTEHVNVNILLDQRRQTWADSDTEKIIKSILGFAKLNGCSVAVINDGTNHVKLFETMKKEFRLLRILWRQVFDEISAIDELSQATTRLRIQDPNEHVPDDRKKTQKATLKALSSGITEKADKIMNIHVLSRHEVDLKIEQIEGDYIMGKDSLAVHMGQVLYLETLNKNGYGQKGAFNQDDCPICANRLGHQWCVLSCGHSFCSDCIKELCSRSAVQTLLCPLCRALEKVGNISFIDTRIEEEEWVASVPSTSAGPSASTASCLPPTSPVEVKGSHSTKVEAIVETLLRLQESHRGEKVLIFSTWTNVLDIIARALIQNDIPYCELMNSNKNKFHETIERFKNREDIQALLIPLQSGSKGLNLIEATHVLLVEPIFNLASESQAIGRVHRIGQTKPTYVHRFYIRKTIEEQLFEILKFHDVSSDDEGFLTLANLQQIVSSGTGTGYRLEAGTSSSGVGAENLYGADTGQENSQSNSHTLALSGSNVPEEPETITLE